MRAHPAIICPACGRKDVTLFVCARCWNALPFTMKTEIRARYSKRLPVEAAVERAVAWLKRELPKAAERLKAQLEKSNPPAP